MKTFTFDLPAMYGDHHVMEVRRILLDMPGVEDVYASSAFQVLEVRADESKVDEKKIESALEEGGYLGDLPVAVERTEEGGNGKDETFFRHTESFTQTRGVIGFGQKVSYQGRPLWPCPGIGTIKQVVD